MSKNNRHTESPAHGQHPRHKIPGQEALRARRPKITNVFGVPNPIIGVAGFAIVAAIGVGLLAGGRYTAWYWVTVQIGVTFAVVFVHWLIYQSLYIIGALCPYCMAVWAVTIPIFWYTSTRNLRSLGRRQKWITLLNEYRGAVLTGWFLLLIVLIANRFWDYWTTLV